MYVALGPFEFGPVRLMSFPLSLTLEVLLYIIFGHFPHPSETYFKVKFQLPKKTETGKGQDKGKHLLYSVRSKGGLASIQTRLDPLHHRMSQVSLEHFREIIPAPQGLSLPIS